MDVAETDASAPLPGWLETPPEPVEPPVVDPHLARRLRAAGLTWSPRSGDRFIVPDRDMDDRIFLMASMVVEVRTLPAGPMIAFNGTTEWALDSLLVSEALWLPTEADLRHELGEHFLALRRAGGRWAVEMELDERVLTVEHPDVVGAHALALLEVLTS